MSNIFRREVGKRNDAVNGWKG